ncbi:MAG: hypothetical protein ACP5QK_06685 [Myxococcota bacterium]
MLDIFFFFLSFFLEVKDSAFQFDEGVGVIFRYLIEDLKSNQAFNISRRCSIEQKEYIHTVELVFDKLKLDVVNTTPDSDDYKNCEGVEIESIALTKEKALCYNKEEPSIINVGFIAFMDKSCQNELLKYSKKFLGKLEKDIPFDHRIIQSRCNNMNIRMKFNSPGYYNMTFICEDRVGIVFINKEMLQHFENTRRLIEEKVEAIENMPKAKDDF